VRIKHPTNAAREIHSVQPFFENRNDGCAQLVEIGVGNRQGRGQVDNVAKRPHPDAMLDAVPLLYKVFSST
jgi:hypothetical protein